ncbi:MAG TPA: RNA methyltransferase [Acidimicrobiales bacterium]|nr:RNA methyltransferase [Acidimicrobiales bacterium]
MARRDPLEDYRHLNDPARRRAVERHGGFFVTEGMVALQALLESPYPVRSVLATRRKAERVRRLVAGRAPVVVRDDEEVAAIAGFHVHRGVLAAADRLPLPAAGELLEGARLVVLAEGLNDHENLGALFRNAAAFGVDAVLIDPTTADPLYRRSVRVSSGHVLRVPWTRVDGWPGALAGLREAGWCVAALTPAAGAEPVDDLAARHPARLALLVGAEGPGLTAAALAAADTRVRIPMASGVDSLNVATAAAVALYAVTRRSG